MKVGVLSDTHLHDQASAKLLAERLLQGPFAEAEAILHAGDVVTSVLEEYFAPLLWYAVRGNMDHALTDTPLSRIISLAGRRIGMIHGWGLGADVEQQVLAYFSARSIDAIVFGHTHQPVCRRAGQLLLFNPGSATDRRQAAFHTVGILTVGDKISGEIIPLDA